jgi:hypothetical protein
MDFMNHQMVGELDTLTAEMAASRTDRVLMFTGGIDGIFITHHNVGKLACVAEDQAHGEPPRGDAGLPQRRVVHHQR